MRGRSGVVAALVLVGTVLVAAGAAAPPPNEPAVDLVVDYQARVIGQRGVGIGQAVNAGDVNGDGVPDAIVAAPGRRTVVYIVYGQRSWRRTVAAGSLTAVEGYRLVTRANVETLLPVADAGDVNGDSIPDQLIGVPNGAGVVYVVYGRRGGDVRTVDLDQLQPSEGYRIEGAPGDSAGTDVWSAGDVNGDNVPDQLIGAPQGLAEPGRAYVVYGQRPATGTIELETLADDQGYRIDGAAGDEAGNAVRDAGDVNRDSVPDALVGGMSADHAYLVYGQRTATPETIDLSTPGSWGYGMHGVPLTLTGASVDNAGDVNGDGVPDALVGAPGCEANAPPNSTTYVVYGQRTPPGETIELATLPAALGYRIVDSQGGCSGNSVVGMPDLNGDGVPDQLIGAFGSRWAGGDGAAFLVYGQRTATPRTVDLAAFTPADGWAIGGIPHAAAGWVVADAGDVDGDSTADAWVWAPNFSPTPSSAGAVYLAGEPQPASTPQTSAATLSRAGTVRIRLACSALPGSRCTGSLTLRTRARPFQNVGSARFSIGSTATTFVTVRLVPSYARRLRRLHRVNVDARATTNRTQPAPSALRTRRVLLRAR